MRHFFGPIVSEASKGGELVISKVLQISEIHIRGFVFIHFSQTLQLFQLKATENSSPISQAP
jgi:hypothetical protein